MDEHGQNTGGIDETRFKHEIMIWDGQSGPRPATVEHDGETVGIDIEGYCVWVALSGRNIEVRVHKVGSNEELIDPPVLELTLESRTVTKPSSNSAPD